MSWRNQRPTLDCRVLVVTSICWLVLLITAFHPPEWYLTLDCPLPWPVLMVIKGMVLPFILMVLTRLWDLRSSCPLAHFCFTIWGVVYVGSGLLGSLLLVCVPRTYFFLVLLFITVQPMMATLYVNWKLKPAYPELARLLAPVSLTSVVMTLFFTVVFIQHPYLEEQTFALI